MKQVAQKIVLGVVALLLIGAGIYGAINDVSYWGWFLFAGVIIAMEVKD